MFIYHPSSAETEAAEEIDIRGTSEGTKNEIRLAEDGDFFVVSLKSICWSNNEVTLAKLRLTKYSPKIP